MSTKVFFKLRIYCYLHSQTYPSKILFQRPAKFHYVTREHCDISLVKWYSYCFTIDIKLNTPGTITVPFEPVAFERLRSADFDYETRISSLMFIKWLEFADFNRPGSVKHLNRQPEVNHNGTKIAPFVRKLNQILNKWFNKFYYNGQYVSFQKN